MEDDDEFGDLYADVMPSLTSATPLQSTAPSPTLRIDLNKQIGDGEIMRAVTNFNFNFKSSSSNQIKNGNPAIVFEPSNVVPGLILTGNSDPRGKLDDGEKVEIREPEKADEDIVGIGKIFVSDSTEPTQSRVLESTFEDLNVMDASNFNDKDGFTEGKYENSMGEDDNFQKFDVEEADTGFREPIIPGVSVPGVSDAGNYQADMKLGARDEASVDDWDSDSEDDLQIVLNDNSHGQLAMEKAGGARDDDDDEDEDEEPLVIVADSNQNHQIPDEQEWGEDATDGERKELGDAVKVNGGVMPQPKIGYINHGYHPFHSQFKYVRPGAAPMPGAAPPGPGGLSSQVRMPVSMAPIAGRGRGDWRPLGVKNASSMQRGFTPGSGLPVLANNMPGRAFGSGLEFTLPSYKNIFDVDINSFEEKPWSFPGIDISDFFNFGLNEESWKGYSKQLEQLRLEGTMQSKIRVHETGRTEQEYDPDLPPELAAAAAGIRNSLSENTAPGKMEAEQSDLGKNCARVRPLPTGRAIQVETSNVERFPSIDTRPPRYRDSDAIIEIVLQDSSRDDSYSGNGVVEQQENHSSGEDLRKGHEVEGDIALDVSHHFEGLRNACNGEKRELAAQRVQNGILLCSPKAPSQYNPDSKGQNSAKLSRNFGSPREERWTKAKLGDKSPSITPSEGREDRMSLDNQKQDSAESTGGQHTSKSSPPVSMRTAGDHLPEIGNGRPDVCVLVDKFSEMERDCIASDKTSYIPEDEKLLCSVKRKKICSPLEPSLHEIDDGDNLKAAGSSDSKARSGSSKSCQELQDEDEEVVQEGRSLGLGNIKKTHGEDGLRVRRKHCNERSEVDRHPMVKIGSEDSYSRKDHNSNTAQRLLVKNEGVDRRKERDNLDGAWLRRDDDPHGRRPISEDTRKRERGEEMGSRHWVKIRASERIDKDENLQLKKQLDDGGWKGHHDKDIRLYYSEKDDNSKSRYDMDGRRSKRSKDEEYSRREHAEKEEMLHGPRDITTRQKRERDDILDHRKKDDRARRKDDDHHSVRHKEENWSQRERGERQRERDEWLRPKLLHEESSSKHEREEGRGGVRNGRAGEDKVWVSHTRIKDEHKGSDREYQSKDSGWQSGQLKRRDRGEDGSLSQYRGREDVKARNNQSTNDERRSRQERGSISIDRAIPAFDNHRGKEKKHKDEERKINRSEGGDHNSTGMSKKKQDGGQINEPVISKGKNRQGTDQGEITENRRSSKKIREDASSGDEQQDSQRGRSKLERWTSHKDTDFSIGSKSSSSSLKIKEMETHTMKIPDESSQIVDSVLQPLVGDDEGDANNLEAKNDDTKAAAAAAGEDRHLDTVEKLKKRSERFKLPMPSEKETVAIKKMESEPLPAVQSELRGDSEIKQERPARKRRWISS